MGTEKNKLNFRAWVFTVSLLTGLYLFVLGLLNTANLGVWWFSKDMLTMAVGVYPGFSATILGSFIGLVWGLVCGAICGGILAGVHNWMVDHCPWVRKK